MKDSFYSSFENKYRGSRDSIKSRLQVYIPLAQKLLSHFPEAIALDLGCGRGEWLELVREVGFKENGVDLDEGMLEYCHELNLNVKREDALKTLASFPDNSIAIISSFHLVEHIGFESVNKLVKEALRVLKPGGILIMETPNPENIIVSSNNYYLDPTHNNPIPRQLLSFLTEHAGFARTKILRLQEDSALITKENITLYDVFNGVSPDYSIVAQKSCDEPDLFNEFNDFFSTAFGISLEFLAKKYHNKLDQNFNNINGEILSLRQEIKSISGNDGIVNELASIKELVKNLEEANNKLQKQAIDFKNENAKIKKEIYKIAVQDPKGYDNKINEKIDELNTNKMVLNKLFACQEELKSTTELIIAMRGSTSWKITYPLRLLGRIIKGENKSPLTSVLIKKPIKIVVLWCLNKVNKNPKRRIALVRLCKKTGLDKFLKPIYIKFVNHSDLMVVSPQEIDHGDILNANLSSHGNDILNKLKR